MDAGAVYSLSGAEVVLSRSAFIFLTSVGLLCFLDFTHDCRHSQDNVSVCFTEHGVNRYRVQCVQCKYTH